MPIDPTPGAHSLVHSAEQPTHTVPNPLLKELFANGDDDEGDDPTAVSALCQSFLGHPSPFRALAPNVDTINGDGVAPVGSAAGCSTPQNETTVAVNPDNPRNIVEGANDYRIFNARENRIDSSGWAYTSTDGGRTWKDVELPKLNIQTGATGALSFMDAAGDPAIAFGPHNIVYYATLVFSRAEVPVTEQNASGIAVSISHNGGLTFGDPVILHLDGVNPDGTPTPTSIFNDKEWITADPRTGTVYVTWTQFTFDADGNFIDSPVVVTASRDFGRTWSAPQQVSPDMSTFTGGITSFGSGSNPRIGNDGTLYVAYETSVCQTAACDAPTDHDAVVMAISHNGGRTFTNTEVALDFDFPFNDDIGNSALTGENFRINSFPQLAYDRITNRLWVTWADDSDGQYANGVSVKTNGDSFLASSRDGVHWSTPTKIGSSSDEVFPAVAARAGHVAVSFYTRADDPHGVGLDYAFVAGDNGTSGAIRRITTQTSDPRVEFPAIGADSGEVLQGTFIGDYSAMDIGTDLQVHPSWTDFRGSPGTTLPNQDVNTQSISVQH
ncbi:MAG TPA: sialidase family protein [Pseudonocardiaceae bacterium]|nr:sialidase family protein [Pseudonocardiaceae bacterium]